MSACITAPVRCTGHRYRQVDLTEWPPLIRPRVFDNAKPSTRTDVLDQRYTPDRRSGQWSITAWTEYTDVRCCDSDLGDARHRFVLVGPLSDARLRPGPGGTVSNAIGSRVYLVPQLPLFFDERSTKEANAVPCDRVVNQPVYLYGTIFDENFSHLLFDNLLPLFYTIWHHSNGQLGAYRLLLRKVPFRKIGVGSPFVSDAVAQRIARGMLEQFLPMLIGDAPQWWDLNTSLLSHEELPGRFCFSSVVVQITNMLQVEIAQGLPRLPTPSFLWLVLHHYQAGKSLPIVADHGHVPRLHVLLVKRVSGRGIFLNHAEMLARLQADRHFVTQEIDFAKHRFSETYATLFRTDIMVHFIGAASANGLFMQRGSAVVYLFPFPDMHHAEFWPSMPAVQFVLKAGLNTILWNAAEADTILDVQLAPQYGRQFANITVPLEELEGIMEQAATLTTTSRATLRALAGEAAGWEGQAIDLFDLTR